MEYIRKQRPNYDKRLLSKVKWGNHLSSPFFWCMLLFVLLLLVFITFLVSCVCFYENGDDGGAPIFFSAFQFYNPVSSDVSKSHVIWFGLISLFALLVTPFLTTSLMRSFELWRNIRREGRKLYRNIKNHFVIIGFNRYTIQILNRLLSHNQQCAIIMTTQDPIKIREALDNHMDSSISTRVIIYAGDAIIEEKVASLNLVYAQTLFLLQESVNSSPYTHNLSILKNIVNATSSREKDDPLEVYMQINSSKAYNLLQRVDIPNDFFKYNGKTVVDFRPFNFHENWARLLWSYYVLKDNNGKPVYEPLDFEPLENTDNHVHLVISGFNSMGRALLLEALRLCHYPNYDDKTQKNKTIISVFDDQLKYSIDNFTAQYPNIDEITDIQIDFYDFDINAPEARKKIEAWAKSADKLLTIAICDKEADVAMTYALNLPKVVFYQKELFKHEEPYENYNRTRVLVRQEIEKSFDEMFAYENVIAYPHIKSFGSLEEGLCLDQLDDNVAICINGIYTEKSINGDYLDALYIESLQDCLQKISEVFDKERTKGTWRERWNELSENMKWSNRFQADIYHRYIALLDRIQRLPHDEFNKIKELLPSVEHRRWCAERVTASWRQKEQDGYRINPLHIHKSIIPFSEMPDSERVKDFNVIASAKLIVEEAEKMNNL